MFDRRPTDPKIKAKAKDFLDWLFGQYCPDEILDEVRAEFVNEPEVFSVAFIMIIRALQNAGVGLEDTPWYDLLAVSLIAAWTHARYREYSIIDQLKGEE